MRQTLFEQMQSEIERNKKGGDSNIGKKVGASTLLVKEIGRGAMGAVYLGYDTKLDRQVAVKVLLREMFADQRQFELLKTLLVQEGRNLAKVKHRGIVEVYELDDQFPALIMELIENGEDLQTFLYRKKDEWATTGFRLWFLSIMEQIAFALGAAHAQGVIHKDLKFGNVMIFKDSEGEWRTKVIDFGLAQNLMHIKLTHGVQLMGSPSYMAPEQWEDHWAIDAKADVYSFGVMLYEVLMQRDYHESEHIEEIKANAKDSLFVQKRTGHLPIDQRTIFEFLLSIERSKRAGGMLEVVGVLRNLRLAIDHRDREAPGTSFPPPPTSAKEAVVPPQSSHKVMDQVQAEFEDGLETPPPVSVPIDGLSMPKAKPQSNPVRGGTILGPQVAPVPEQVPEPVQAPASVHAPVHGAASFSIVVEQHVVEQAQPTPQPLEDLEPMSAHEEHVEHENDKQDVHDMHDEKAKVVRRRLVGMIIIVVLLFGGLGAVMFALDKAKRNKAHDEDQKVAVTEQKMEQPQPEKAEPPKEVPEKIEPTMAPTETPEKIEQKKPEPKKPEIKPVPSIPAPPTKVGEFPSNEYATYMFSEWDKWCAQNDPRRAEFAKFPMWRAICLRKKVVELYSKNRSNPETAVAMADEIWAHMCFQEMVYRKQGQYTAKDTFLDKECAAIKNLAYKGFTYFIGGDRIHAVDKFLTERRARRLQIREEWMKANSTEKPQTTP